LTAANGQFVGFYEFKPADYNNNPTAKFPLIIFLHGIGERGDGMAGLPNMVNVGIPGYINRGATMSFNGQSFLVLSPQLSINYGSWQNFYVDEMLNYATNNLRVDPNRIYLTGLSLGGGGTWKYASSSQANAAKFAAIAPICGTCDYSNLCNIASANTATWAFHAVDDGIVGVGCTQGAVNMLTSCGGATPPKVTYYQSGNHYIWDMAYDMTHSIQSPQNLFEWFLSKSRSGGGTPPPPTPAPIANAGTDQTVTLPASSSNLNGSGSYSQNGSITSYNWTEVSGPNTANMSNAWGANNTVSGLVAGTYTFRLKVTDNTSATATADVKVVVSGTGGGGGGGTAPVAIAGNDQSITLPTNTVFLAGSGSYVPGGGTISNYAWSQVSGPNTASIQTLSSTNVSASNLVAGSYVFRLTVTSGGGTNTDDVAVTVTGTGTPPPPPTGNGQPVAVAGNDQNINPPSNSVFLLGSGSYVQGGGTITGYAWSQVSGPNAAAIQTMSSTNIAAGNLISGSYVFRLTVTSAGGSNSDDVTVNVGGTTPPPPPPSGNGQPVAIPGNNQTITLPTNSVFLAGSGSYVQGGGTITGYAWSQVSGPNTASLQTLSPSNISASNLTSGTYVFKLTVTSAGGSNSANVTVTVNGTAPPPPPTSNGPTAAAGPDQSIWGTSAFLRGSGSYDNTGGYITSYTWSQVSGPNTASLGWMSNTNVEARGLARGT
jgi:predicted esterase